MLKKLLLYSLIFILFSCDNKQKISFPDTVNIEMIDVHNSNVSNLFENNFRVILIAEFTEDMHINLHYTNNNNEAFSRKHILYPPKTTEKAAYFSFTNGELPYNLNFSPWSNRNYRKGQIKFQKIIFRYKGKTMEITSDQLLDYFSINEFLEFDNSVLSPKKTELKNFKPELKGNSKFIDKLHKFLSDDENQSDNLKVITPDFDNIKIDENQILVNFNVVLKKTDELTFFYILDENKYTSQNSKTILVNGKNDVQSIIFSIDKKKGLPKNFRLDYGETLNQQIEIKSIKINNSDKQFVIAQNQVSRFFNAPPKWNKTIDAKRAIYQPKENNGIIDPKLLGNKNLVNKLKTLQ